MNSLRATLKPQGVDGCPNGLKSLVAFYTTSEAARKSFGFDRLSQILDALRWPKAFQPASSGEDYPHSDGQSWQNKMQGVAHDDVMWFFTKEDALETVPFGWGLHGLGDYHFNRHEYDAPLGNGRIYPLTFKDGEDGIARIKVPVNYNHMSALSIQRTGATSILYIPIQGERMREIYAVEVHTGQTITDWNWRATIPMAGDQGAWCAFDPLSKRLYTSDFWNTYRGKGPGSAVDVYAVGTPDNAHAGRPQPGQKFQITFLGKLDLFEADGHTPATLARVQGGFITANRHLYLVVDDHAGVNDHSGIVGFDLITGRRRITIQVNYTYGTTLLYQELEGACLFINPPAPGIGGDIHVILWENGGGASDRTSG